jgi:hypothetical protein
MNVDESNPVTLDSVAQELNERAANMRARSPDASKVSKEEAALRLAVVLIGEMKERKQTIPYPTEYYAQRVLHLVRWSGSNIGGGVMIEYLIHHGGAELELYLDRLLDQAGYQGREDLPEKMRQAIECMREEGRDPVESYRPGDNKRREIWQCAVEQMHRMDELDPTEWPDMVALVKEIESKHPLLRNREMLIEELTARLVNALKTHNLPVPHGRDWYRSRMATLVFHHAHSLFAGIIICLLLDNIDDPDGRTGRDGAPIDFRPGFGNGANPDQRAQVRWDPGSRSGTA